MVRKVRLTTGLILFVFVASHMANHALGIHSLSAMEAGRENFLLIWRNPIGSAAMMGSLFIHLLLATWALYDRRSLKMSVGEALQLSLGFAIPLLLALHFVGSRGVHQMFGTNDTYAFILLAQWKFSENGVLIQTAGLFAAWIHGCIGLYFWLRLKPWFAKFSPVLLSISVLLPVCAWLGYYAGAKEALVLFEDPVWRSEFQRTVKPPNSAGVNQILDIAFWVRMTVLGLIGVALFGRLGRCIVERRRGFFRIDYPGDKSAKAAPGISILEASRLNDIPHASVCGGRGRCSTCRVRIVEGADNLPDPSSEETKVLDRVGAPPGVRLACQAIPSGNVSVTPLLPPNATVRDARRRSPDLAGQEREIAILFADLRSFTRFSEKKLPYDVVFVLNRYFAHMGEAVEEAGGHLDKFIGDGVMALFGTKTDVASGARQALEAASNMSKKLAELNAQLGDELDEPLRIGIGVHAGPAIIGEMGYGTASGLTAIGDSVNTASRLEAMTKEFGAQLIFSEDVAKHVSSNAASMEKHTAEVPGRNEQIGIFVVKNAESLKAEI
ncbi:MAG: adenylate/guanylate cyclase domain-containing protein [Pseudomonadota bacterium]|nr:adenylate/guanylate cyclase domain-containing protein [Pseudomonadota bacterium]